LEITKSIQTFLKRSLLRVTFIITLFTFVGVQNSSAQNDEPQLTRLLFIFDASNSMNLQWQGSSKIRVAQKLLAAAVDSLAGMENLEIALRMYGHQYNVHIEGQRCDDTALVVPFGPNNHQQVKSEIRGVHPKGTTPIALSLEACANDFPDREARNVVILITDGLEACDGDPCAVSRALKSKGISVRPFVIGVGMDESYLGDLTCIGKVFKAGTEEAFKNVLQVVLSEALNNTTIQVNLLDTRKKPTETNVTMSFYQAGTDKLKYTYMHTLDGRGNPDTLTLDPLSKYRIEVHTIPKVVKDNVKLVPGRHNVIEIDAPQGYLELQLNGRNALSDIPCIIRKKGEHETIHVQKFNSSEKYIVGDYELEALCLPRMYFDVNIKQSETSYIGIPQPGKLSLAVASPGYGAIFVLKDGKEKWVCNLNPNAITDQYWLLPGNYKVVYRSKRSKSSAYTITKEFNIQSGDNTNVNL
jgi:Ca-activated chloride channel family protein